MDRRLVIILTVLAVGSAAVVIAIILGIVLSQPKGSSTSSNQQNQPRSSIITTRSSTTTRASTTTGTTRTPSSEVDLIGEFTILHRTVSSVSDDAICNYLTTVVSTAQPSATDCIILGKRSGSVKVRYKLVFGTASTANRQRVMRSASSLIAKYSSDISTFNINQSSIVFENEYGLTPNYCSKTTCSGSNVRCISVVGDYQCVCSAGFTRTSTSGSCSNKQSYVSRYCGSTGLMIAMSKICDEYQDCPDDSDEINCICDTQYQYACKNGRCISGDWLCDGVKDCPQGDDEIYPQCDECGKSQFQCARPRSCISSEKQCDGRSDCQDSSDESKCVSLAGSGSQSGLITVTYKGTAGYKVCSDNWDQAWNDRVCNFMGFGAANSASSSPSNGSFLSLNTGFTSSNFLAYLTTTNCLSQRAVSISCRTAECGTRTISGSSAGPYILNGQRAKRGAWPWETVVYTGYYSYGVFVPGILCGGILINNRWILTAAHCTRLEKYYSQIGYTGQIKPRNLQILLGTISRTATNNPDMVVAYADQVYTHPMYSTTTKAYDVGLIRLSQTVSYSDTVRPICLPDKNQDLKRFDVCVDTGFGVTMRGTDSNDLLQAKMNIMSDSECNQLNRFYSNATQLCIGMATVIGDISICQGDSGGPFACRDSNDVWTVIGVNSYVVGLDYDDIPAYNCLLSVVARVPALVDWIQTTVSANSN